MKIKKVNIAIVLIVLLSATGIVVSSKLGFNYRNLAGVFNSDRTILYNLMTDFLEDIQFKDFDQAATYHTPEEQKKANIPQLIEEKFKIKPEMMDIREFEVQKIHLDRDGERARIHTMVHVKLLNSEELRDIESIFYWHKENGTWYMKLRSSLD